jgi:adenosylhomocysteine nucleosidase
MPTNKIAIIGAMECEVASIKQELKDLKEIVYADLQIFTGNIKDNFIILSKSGVGKVNAALNTQYIIDSFKPNIVINIGVAGGVDRCLNIGDIVIGTDLVQHDFDVSPLGYAKGYMCIGKEKDKPTKYYCDKNLVEKFQNILEGNISKSKIHQGVIASGDQFIADKDVKKEINKNFNALAVEMEGCAIAQVSTRNKIPFIVIRAISDLADGDMSNAHDEFEKYSQVSSQAIKLFVDTI